MSTGFHSVDTKIPINPVTETLSELKHREAEIVAEILQLNSFAEKGMTPWHERDNRIKRDLEPELLMVRNKINRLIHRLF